MSTATGSVTLERFRLEGELEQKYFGSLRMKLVLFPRALVGVAQSTVATAFALSGKVRSEDALEWRGGVHV